jgi:hypothetical protein
MTTTGTFDNPNGTTKKFIIDPKRIQRRIRITQNSQRQLRMPKMAPTDRKREIFSCIHLFSKFFC